MGFASTALQISRSLCLHPCTWAGRVWGRKAPKSVYCSKEPKLFLAGACLASLRATSTAEDTPCLAVCPRILPALLQVAFPGAFTKA